MICPHRLMKPGCTLPELISKARQVSTWFICGSLYVNTASVGAADCMSLSQYKLFISRPKHERSWIRREYVEVFMWIRRESNSKDVLSDSVISLRLASQG